MSQSLEKETNVTDKDGQGVLPSQTQSNTEHPLSSSRPSSRDEEVVQVEAEKAPYNPWADPSSFPDGGSRAWLTVAGAAAAFFVSWG